MTKTCTLNVEQKTSKNGKPYFQLSICVNQINVPIQVDYVTKNILLQLIGK